MYCLCLHEKSLNIMKDLGYIPVGLGKENFSSEWLRDNTLKNISNKNQNYGEYTFHYWFWKNALPKIEDNQWIGFCAHRDYWSKSNKIKNNPNFKTNYQNVPNLLTHDEPLSNYVLKKAPDLWDSYDAIIGDHMFINNLKLSKLIKHGMISLVRNPAAIFKSKRSIRFHFDMWHGNGNLDKAIDLLEDKDREDFRLFTKTQVSFCRGNMFICRSKKIINDFYSSIFPWLENCEKVFGFNKEKYGLSRIYAFLGERYLSYWFTKYTKSLLWPVFFYDIQKSLEKLNEYKN